MNRITLGVGLLATAVPVLGAQEHRAEPLMLQADTSRSSIEFSVRFMGLSRVWGEFHRFSGTVGYPGDPAGATVAFSVDVGSIDTDNGHRDQDLSENWFEMDRFPTASFASDSIVAHLDRWLAHGPLQIKNVVRDVTIPLTIVFEGEGDVMTARARGRFTIDRMIYGVDDSPTPNRFFDASTMVVGDDVTIDLDLTWVLPGG